jgi:hypothetical protein
MRCHHVDALIGTLGAEDGSDEQLPRIAIVQLAVGLGIGSDKACIDLVGIRRESGRRYARAGACSRPALPLV